MNNLFKDGDYVLLSDCESYDDKYGLKAGTTMWAVARKMEGGEPDDEYMLQLAYDECVGVDDGDVGIWKVEASELTNQLTVEEVLYRSENGLTLDELAKIPCAFEDGKEYKCIQLSGSLYVEGSTYKTNSVGIVDEWDDGNNTSYCSSGSGIKFKPVHKKEFIPKVGDKVIYNDTYETRILLDADVDGDYVFLDEDGSYEFACKSAFKPIDHKRKQTIKKINEMYREHNSGVSGSEVVQCIGLLYDLNLLKDVE